MSELLVLRVFRKEERGWQVRGRTASRLDEDYVGLMPGGERFTSHQVGADVFADGRVGATSRLNGENPVGGNRTSVRRRHASASNELVCKARGGVLK